MHVESKTIQAVFLIFALMWIVGTSILIKPDGQENLVALKEGFYVPNFILIDNNGTVEQTQKQLNTVLNKLGFVKEM